MTVHGNIKHNNVVTNIDYKSEIEFILKVLALQHGGRFVLKSNDYLEKAYASGFRTYRDVDENLVIEIVEK